MNEDFVSSKIADSRLQQLLPLSSRTVPSDATFPTSRFVKSSERLFRVVEILHDEREASVAEQVGVADEKEFDLKFHRPRNSMPFRVSEIGRLIRDAIMGSATNQASRVGICLPVCRDSFAGRRAVDPREEFSLENPTCHRQIRGMAEEKNARQIPWARFPELAALCWNLHRPSIAAGDALRLYEDNWRFVNQAAMPPAEKKLVNWLAERFGSFLHV